MTKEQLQGVVNWCKSTFEFHDSPFASNGFVCGLSNERAQIFKLCGESFQTEEISLAKIDLDTN